MNLCSKRLVVSYGKPEQDGKLVVEETFPGLGPLGSGEKVKNLLILAWYSLTKRKIMTYGELQCQGEYIWGERAKAFFQLVEDMAELGTDNSIRD